MVFLLLPEFGSFLSIKVVKETDSVFFRGLFSMLFERVVKSRYNFHLNLFRGLTTKLNSMLFMGLSMYKSVQGPSIHS